MSPEQNDAVGMPVPAKPSPARPAEIDFADLKRKSVRGGAITLISQGATVAIQLASTVILARLLNPEDYGIIAMVMAIVSFAALFRDLGLSSAAIQKKGLTGAQQSNLFWLNVAMGAILTVIVAACAPLVARFYGKPELVEVTVALSVTFLIGSLGTQHGAMLVRRMSFGRKAVATVAGALVTLVVAVAFALHKASYWALVWGSLAGSATTTGLLTALSPFMPGKIARGTGIHDMLKFGADITAFDLVNYFHRNLDGVLIGKVWGPEALGIYSRSYSLLMMVINAVRAPIIAVSFPSLSRLKHHPQDFREYARRTTGVIAFLSMPLVAYLGVSSKWIIPLALGTGWEECVPIFTMLSIAAFVQPVSVMRGQVMLSLGRSRRFLYWGVANALVTSFAFVFAVPWGSLAVAGAYSAATLGVLVPSVYYAYKNSPLRPSDFFGPIVRPAFASLLSAAVVYSLEFEPLRSPSSAVLSAIVFASIYLLTNMVSDNGRSDLRSAASMLRLKAGT